jgi:hypothetical protein
MTALGRLSGFLDQANPHGELRLGRGGLLHDIAEDPDDGEEEPGRAFPGLIKGEAAAHRVFAAEEIAGEALAHEDHQGRVAAIVE